jgi:cobalamin biosynthesis protein CobT
MKNLIGITTGSPTVFSRRIEDEGREAAVILLIDVSGSMSGFPLQCAKALALHMGDALKAAGVRFEVSAFDDRFLVTPKPLAKPWNNETKRAVAALRCMAGTCMLTAIRACAERLVKTPNVTRRILMVLSDGADSYSASANGLQCATLRRRGVEVVGLALMSPGMETAFAGAVVNVRSAAQLSEQGLATLVKTLDAGAPRLG